MPLDILYRDDALVVVNKPGGLLVHRTRESSDRVFLLQELGAQLGCFLYPVHRLDRATSGAIAFAFTPEGARALQEILSADDTCKEYLALVRGEAAERGEIDRPLTGDTGVRRPARTEFERLAHLPELTIARGGLSLLKVRISTGRRHQIRRHLAHLHHHILGDTSHGKGRINRDFREAFGLPRLCLHAWRLSIRHPDSSDDDTRLDVRAPLADDLRTFFSKLPGMPAGLLEEL